MYFEKRGSYVRSAFALACLMDVAIARRRDFANSRVRSAPASAYSISDCASHAYPCIPRKFSVVSLLNRMADHSINSYTAATDNAIQTDRKLTHWGERMTWFRINTSWVISTGSIP